MLPLAMFLTACVPADAPEVASRARIAESTLPPIKAFAPRAALAPQRSNRDIARDFLDLSFQLESGKRLDTFTRFEGPISLRVTGRPGPTLAPDLRALLGRLRREAGIAIVLTDKSRANITIEAVSRDQIARVLPQAACFVAPNVSSFSEYRAARRKPQTDWSRLDRREQIAIFLPADASPQEVRDCLHEELAQALGPLNDLYRLADSVFNDDNVHTVLTGFDMLILRTTYDPALRTGMTRAQVAAALPGILARLNPEGRNRPSRNLSATPRAWSLAIQSALGRTTSPADRTEAARRALRIA
ncbi:MAG: DUF2927 domain-containing protein, partial [Sulfitobacter sp.]|nr:DUF2927 domain-containing protein [Sulfitobacter sp.]